MFLKKKVIIVLTISGLILMILGLLLSDSQLKTDNVIVLLLSLLLSIAVFSVGIFFWILVASSLSDTAWGKIDEAIEKKEKEIQAQKN